MTPPRRSTDLLSRWDLADGFGLRFWLLHGSPGDAEPEPPARVQRAAWAVLRDELIAETIAKTPGERPAAWWRYDASHVLGSDAPLFPPLSAAPDAEDRALRALLAHGVVDDAEQDAIDAIALSDDPSLEAERARQRARVVFEHRRARAGCTDEGS